MNWLSTFARARPLVALLFTLSACGAPASEPQQSDDRRYALHYRVEVLPGEQAAQVELQLEQDRYLLREMRFDTERIEGLSGDGELRIGDGSAVWLPPDDGGELRWRVPIPHRRNANGYDAWLDDGFGLFRAEDIIPRASTRTLRDAASDTELSFSLPTGWNAVTPYRERRGAFQPRSTTRRFVQPSGWIVLGNLGVRRDRIAGIRVAIAAPEGHGARRIDMLALLNWSLPELVRVFPDPPSRLTIVSAGEPMWRGGLSGPSSVFIHADRPLISENGTSTLLHEVAHVLMSARSTPDMDWILEGLAEYYSLEALRRGGTLSADRYARAIRAQQNWAEDATRLCGGESSGARTALAVTTLHAVDVAIAASSNGERGLDDVVQALLESVDEIDLAGLQAASVAVAGEIPDALHIDNLAGCRNMSAPDEAT